MIQMLAKGVETLQNVYTPLSFKAHFIFCLIATLVYLIQFSRKRAPHYLLVMVAIDLTFVTQYCTENYVIGTLFGAEVLLLTLAGIFSHRYNKKLKLAEKADEADEESESNENSNS